MLRDLLFRDRSGQVFHGEPHTGNIDEHVFLTRGRISITMADQEYSIKAGEFLKFRADQPHTYRCLGEETAAAIMQVSYHG